MPAFFLPQKAAQPQGKEKKVWSFQDSSWPTSVRKGLSAPPPQSANASAKGVQSGLARVSPEGSGFL